MRLVKELPHPTSQKYGILIIGVLMLRYCYRWKLKIEEDWGCVHCEYNKPITLDWKTNCQFPSQLEWSVDFKNILWNGEIR